MIVNACAEKLFLKLIYYLLISTVIKNLENKYLFIILLGVFMLKDFLNIISKYTSNLEKEKLVYAVSIFFILSFFAIFFLVGFYYILHDSFALPLALSFECFALIGFIVVWDYDKIFIRESDASFETMITVLLFIGFSFLIGWSVIGIFSSQMLCFIIGFSFFYSVFWMFLKRKAYDKTTELFKVNKCIGYHPVYYLFLGGITGIILFGFSAILLNNLLNEGIYFIYLFGILISFIIESLILSPDIMNKVLPFEVRKKSGFILYSILTVVLSVIFCMLMNFFI